MSFIPHQWIAWSASTDQVPLKTRFSSRLPFLELISSCVQSLLCKNNEGFQRFSVASKDRALPCKRDVEVRVCSASSTRSHRPNCRYYVLALSVCRRKGIKRLTVSFSFTKNRSLSFHACRYREDDGKCVCFPAPRHPPQSATRVSFMCVCLGEGVWKLFWLLVRTASVVILIRER